ncbi:hypothetical protein [Streptomyces atratus]|uniref:hypothetical protein n=1 Tax=Streptomyces TaxID=1883 RepID=UPI0037B67D74
MLSGLQGSGGTGVFGLLAVAELDPPASQTIVPVVACTVLLSVFAHGITSPPSPDATEARQTSPARPRTARPWTNWPFGDDGRHRRWSPAPQAERARMNTRHLLRDDLFAPSSPSLYLSIGIVECRDQGPVVPMNCWGRPGELVERVGAHEHHRSLPGEFGHFVPMRFTSIR